MISAVLFDLDGVLLDAREWHYETLNSAIASLAGPEFVISSMAHDSFYNGLPTKVKLQFLTKQNGLPQELHEAIYKEKQRLTAEKLKTVTPIPAHVQMCQELKKRGMSLGVCSNAISQTTTTALKNLELDGFMSVVVSNEDVDKPKPAPDMYQQAMRTLHKTPNQVLVIEDSDYGLQAALAAGMRYFMVASPADLTFDKIRPALS